MKIHPDGWLSGVRRVPSPNYDARPANQRIDLLIIHSISLPPEVFHGSAVERFFMNQLDTNSHPYYEQLKNVRVSAHFFIRRGGEIVQFVSCNHRAWHAGVSSWKDRTKCNDFSIGIELEGSDSVPYTERQYQRLRYLVRRIKNAYPIEDVTGHSDVAPGRKTDPGPHFDWSQI